MKRKLISTVLALTLSVSVLSGCGSTAANNDTSSEANAADTSDTASAEESGATEEEKALAQELIDRSPTPEDNVTKGVVDEVVTLLKDKYEFEDVKEILVSGDTDTYVASGAGWYDALFNDSGIKVTIQQSVDDNEATLMERGELTFANRMLYPYLLNKQNNADVVAVWNSGNPAPEIVSVVVKSDSDYESFADLKGKKIASSAAGCPYSVLVELADHEGWTEGVDYTHVNTKEYVAALLAGEVDAIVYHPDWNISSVLLSGEAKIIDNALEDGVYVGGGGSRVIFTPTQYAKDNPNVVHGYVKLMEVVSAYLVNNKEDAAKIQESIDRTPAEGVEYWIDVAKETYYTNTLTLDEIKANSLSYDKWLIEHDESFDSELDMDNGIFAEEYFN